MRPVTCIQADTLQHCAGARLVASRSQRPVPPPVISASAVGYESPSQSSSEFTPLSGHAPRAASPSTTR